jgi:hypothetical protein
MHYRFRIKRKRYKLPRARYRVKPEHFKWWRLKARMGRRPSRPIPTHLETMWNNVWANRRIASDPFHLQHFVVRPIWA